MRPVQALRLVLVASVFLCVGCSSNVKGKIEGTKWTSQAATIKGQQIPAGFLQLDFNADGSLVYRAGPQTLTGTYSLGMGDNVTWNLNQELAGRKTHVEKTTINGNVMTVTDSDGTALSFDKVK